MFFSFCWFPYLIGQADRDPALRNIPENTALLEAVESFKELVQIAAMQDEYIAEADRVLESLEGAMNPGHETMKKLHLHETVRTLQLLLGSFDTIRGRMARISKSAEIPQQVRSQVNEPKHVCFKNFDGACVHC